MENAFDRAAVNATRNAIERARDAMNYLTPDSAWLNQTRLFDPAKAILERTRERLTGIELEVTQELDRRHPRTSGNSAVIPYETLAFRSARHRMNQTRADIAGTTSVGGYLVPTVNFANAAQALMSMLVLGRLGATAVDATGPNLDLPKVNTSASAAWLPSETTTLTESDQAFGQQGFSPHTVGGYTEISRLLLLQSNAGDVVSNDLSRKVARAIEAAAFAGTGAAGQPKGLATASGVNSVSGTTFSLATACTAATDLGDALTDDASPGWATTRSVASLLRQRAELSGSSNTLWRGPLTWGTLADAPAAGTSGVPTADAFFGAWAYLVLVNWGGLEVAVNPYAQSNFQAGIVGVRALATVDVGTVWPAAFTLVSSIT